MATKKTLVGKAPLSLVRTSSGAAVYVYAGQPAPSDVTAEDRKRLLKDGYLVEVDVVDDVVPVPDDPATGNPDGAKGTSPQRPKATATKPAWVEFRGLTEEQADALTLDQLKDDAFMASHQPDQPAA